MHLHTDCLNKLNALHPTVPRLVTPVHHFEHYIVRVNTNLLRY